MVGDAVKQGKQAFYSFKAFVITQSLLYSIFHSVLNYAKPSHFDMPSYQVKCLVLKKKKKVCNYNLKEMKSKSTRQLRYP